MPYTYRKVGDEWCLFKKDTGEKVGCSDSRKEVIAYKRAKYAHEDSKGKKR